jgi:NADH dehydrogenase (ubiquinone) flavoprotein 2
MFALKFIQQSKKAAPQLFSKSQVATQANARFSVTVFVNHRDTEDNKEQQPFEFT